MGAQEQKRTLQLLYAAILSLAGWLLAYGQTLTPTFVFDDSYITLSNALTLSGGANPYGTAAATGATSIVHLLLTALAISSKIQPETALGLICLVFYWFYSLGIIKLVGQAPLPPTVRILLSLILPCIGLSIFQGFNGLETSLALSAITWSMIALRNKQYAQLGLIGGILPWIRPELFAWSGLCAICILIESKNKGRVKNLAIYGTAAIIAFLPFLIFYHQNTGDIIPSTISAKLAWFSEDCAATAWKNAAFIHGVKQFQQQIGITTILGFTGLLLTSTGRIGAMFIIAILSGYYFYFPGALGHYETRYQYIFLPFLAWGLIDMLPETEKIWKPASLLITLILLANTLTIDIPANIEKIKEGRYFTKNHLSAVSEWFNKNAPLKATVLVHDAGYISYKTDLKLSDLVGLKTPSNIEVHQTITHPSCGHNRAAATAAIILKIKPEYFVFLNTWDKIFQLQQALRIANLSYEIVMTDQNGYSILKIKKEIH